MKLEFLRARGRRYSAGVMLALLGWVLTLLVAKALRWGFSPATWLPTDRPLIYVGRACGGADAISRAVLARDDLGDTVYLVPVFSLREMGPKYEEVDHEFVEAVCAKTIPQIEFVAPWLRIVPPGVQCRWLAEDATLFNEELAKGGLPTVVLGGSRVAWEREKAVFERFGVLFDVSQPGIAIVRPLAAVENNEQAERPRGESPGEVAGSGEPLRW
ncbi:hypothetical protein [Nannocystis sp. SCPEA4]|uniref:hypothetical protein n=1 Tax=Nannocystis sp. SCPEA4 TaxID=2996787 RepID=UPI0022702814|nr:hypothetical protein [Nannocystis sp. SCPEA4]MCY1056341.1 hypothetical protein [Nannocystis sp. SCPEA4]